MSTPAVFPTPDPAPRQRQTPSERGAITLPDGSERRLDRDFTIGRGPGNDVRLTATSISRTHAILRYTGGRWLIEDRGSSNGTYVNGERVPVRAALPLRHGDRVELGSEALIFSWPAQASDPEDTDPLDLIPADSPALLSPLQLQVVRCLCGAWLGGASLDDLPSNEQIAAQLGTPGATGTVKAALRRTYAKAGLSETPQHAKRRTLCRLARQRGWI